MAVRWLFGDAVTFEGGAVLHPMTFDIDVIADLVRYMRREGSGLTPRLVVRKWEFGLATPTDTVVNLDRLDALSAYERRLLVLESPYDGTTDQPTMTIDFRSNQTFHISSQNVDPELLPLIVGHLKGTGRLRPAWPRIAPILPPAFALLTTVLGVWALASTGANLPTVLYSLALLLALWAASAVATHRLYKRANEKPTGARFREGSRAGVRERLQNTKATVLVSFITIPIGAAIGAIVTAWLGG